MPIYSLGITSCQRHDLLRQTLDSFIETADAMPQGTFIVEDSDAPKPSWLLEDRYRQLGEIKWMANGVRMGQVYSLRRLYDEVPTEWAFHLEDDWLFLEQGFLAPSFSILQKYPRISQVSLRGYSCNGHPLMADPQQYPFLVQEPYWAGSWGGWSWNPSLIRVREARDLVLPRMARHLGQHGLGHEADVSKYFLDAGYRIAVLRNITSGRPDPYIKHIGDGRSRAIEKLSQLPRILIAVPACHALDYGQWESEDSPHYDKAHPPYGTDIHISGKNDRIDAVRDTWFKDTLGYPSLDARFFYGLPARAGQPDEVFLEVKDDYASLPFKTVAICKWALEQGYDYLLKCDDDTYVWVDRLVQEIMERQLDYGGFEHSNVCTGGPGYILSKRAMKIIADSSPTHWAEDCHVGITLTNNHIKPVMLSDHHPGFQAHWFDIGKIPPRSVTIHAVKAEDMRTIFGREHASID